MRLVALLVLLTAVPAAAPAARPAVGPLPGALTALLERTPADSLAAPLRRLEARTRGRAAGDVAYVLGQYHYARGEYRQAADAWGRSAARYPPSLKPEARYWAGLAWLAAGDHGRARAWLEQSLADPSPRRAEATLALAYAWEALGRPQRAFELLDRLVSGDAAEAGPAALERLARLAARMDRRELARRMEDRLRRLYPDSPEATRRSLAGDAP